MVAVLSSAIQSLGITLQRRSHVVAMSYHRKRNVWLVGFFLFIVANVLGLLIQITTLPLIVLSPLQSIGLIFNSAFCCMLLPGEVYTSKLGYGTAIIALGAFIIAYNGNTATEPPETPKFHEVVHNLLAPRFLSWFILTFVAIAALGVTTHFLPKRRKFTKGINYGIISGTLTAHTFLFAKSLVDGIMQSILHNKLSSITTDPTPFILLGLMLMIIALQLTAFNLGLAQISTAILYPLCFLVYNLINLINDVTFNALLSTGAMSVGQLMLVMVGLLFVFLGVLMLSWDSAFDTKRTLGKFPYDTSEVSYEQAQLLSSLEV